MDKKQVKPIEVQLQLLKVQEIGCSINTNILSPENKFDPRNLKIDFGINIKLNLEEEIFILTVMVKYNYDIKGVSNNVLELTSENQFKVLDLKNLIIIKSNGDFEDKANLLPTLLGLSISTIRGMLVVKTAGTILANPPLPIVNPTEILKSIVNINQKKQNP